MSAPEAQQAPRTPSPTPGPQRPGWVRLRTILGESVVPPESAAVIMRAVNRAVAVGDVPRNARWMFVELMAADYLAGQYTERELQKIEGHPTNQGEESP